MNRVSTNSSYLTVLTNLHATQLRQMKAATQVSSQKIASDLKGYSRQAETLTAMRSLQTRVSGFIEQTDLLADKFNTQYIALNQIADAAQGARMVITEALASGRGDTLMQELRGHFSDAVAGLNSKSHGKYLFSGGQLNTLPVTATSMSELTVAPTVDSLFQNDDFVATNRLDETSSVPGGFLADKLGGPLFEAFKALQAFEEGPNGPITGQLTEAQRTFLEGRLAGLDTIRTDLINTAALNGSYQKRIESTQNDLSARSDTLEAMMGNITDVDMAEAVSRLQQAQISVQASAEVFSTLKSSSLLNYLRF